MLYNILTHYDKKNQDIYSKITQKKRDGNISLL